MPFVSYRSREGYKNLRVGAFRGVLGWENRTYNLTFYAYIGDSDYMLDLVVWPWGYGTSLHKF